jgi:NAD(P)-dependent dehydrogenase (short-subunit alcohol dehydrogenase family)
MELGEGKVAVVTGAGSGIGLALAHAFAGAGCSVVLADVQEDALVAAEEAVAAHGTGTLAVPTDVSDAAAVQSLAAATVERFGGVHVVCNNAGVAGLGDPWTGPIESWEWVLGVNLWGVVHGIRAFLPHLVAGGEGHIVNTASIAGLWPGLAPSYDASKHAVVAITEDLYHSLTEAGMPVGVSCLCPGWIRTGIIESDRNWPARFGAPPPGDAAARIVRKHVGRAVDEGMQPAAVADLVVDAVRTGRYWIFPNPDFFELAVERWHRIAEHLDPVPPEQVPGMPPRSQLIGEVFEAMLADLDDGGGTGT